jgi:pyruvate dehydrogenase E1 component alpha subunit
MEITSRFIVENNGYAMGTSVERTANHTDIWKLGLGYEMPCGPVDGMNPESSGSDDGGY